jgi:hypothetical protein
MERNAAYYLSGRQCSVPTHQSVYSVRIPDRVIAALQANSELYELSMTFGDGEDSGGAKVLTGQIAEVNNPFARLCQIRELKSDAKEVYKISGDAGTLSSMSSLPQCQLVASSAGKLAVINVANSNSVGKARVTTTVAPKRSKTIATIDAMSLSNSPAANSAGDPGRIAVGSGSALAAPKRSKVRATTQPTMSSSISAASPPLMIESPLPVMRGIEGVNWLAVESVHPDVDVECLRQLFAGLVFDEESIFCTVTDESTASENSTHPVVLNYYVSFYTFADLVVAISRDQDALDLSPALFSSKRSDRSRTAKRPRTPAADAYASCQLRTQLRQLPLDEWFWVQQVGIPMSALRSISGAVGRSIALTAVRDKLGQLCSQLVDTSQVDSGAEFLGGYRPGYLAEKYAPFLRSIQSKSGNRFVVGGAPGSMLRSFILQYNNINGASGSYESDSALSLEVVPIDPRVELSCNIGRLEMYEVDLLAKLSSSTLVDLCDVFVCDYCSRLLSCYRFMYDQYYKYQ